MTGFSAPRRSLHRNRGMVRLLTSISCLAFLTACGGSEGDPLASFFTIAASPGGSGTFGSYYMAEITESWRLAAASFRNNSGRYQLQDGSFPIGATTVFANPLHSSRVDYAHALGLTGAGQVIAIVDSGFRQRHEVFTGKSNTTTGGPGVTDHGTMVASIAAGSSGTMVGVAPGADLILSEWGSVSFANWTAAANAATARNAVAQNNSWGFDGLYANVVDYNSIFGTAGGQTWLAALQTYALDSPTREGGVVVFAISNDTTATAAGLMDALPVLVPTLETAWIAVGNAIPVFDDNGVSAVARRESASCLGAARWCMVADGFWYAATGTSNSSYDSGTGSSFAAPQVSGALALLAEAFPSLTPHQLRARLLASADNTFTGFETSGTGSVDLLEGPGVYSHDYSEEFGHGFLDIRAALLPIGTTVVTTADGNTIATKDFGFTTGGAMGDAVAQSLSGVNMTVTDAMEGGFEVAAKSFATTASPEPLSLALAARSFDKDLTVSRIAPLNSLAETFGAQSGQTMEMTGPDGQTKAALLMGGGETYGLAIARTLTEGDLQVDLGLKVARDNGALMGFTDSGAGGGADMAAITLGLTHDVGSGGFFALSGEFGLADLGKPTALSSVSTAAFNSVRLDVGGRGVFAKGDRVSFGVSLPIAVTSGSASMAIPVSLAGGSTETRSLDVDLAPTERQVEISVNYQIPLNDSSEMKFEVVHANNFGNQAGMTDSAAILGMTWKF